VSIEERVRVSYPILLEYRRIVRFSRLESVSLSQTSVQVASSALSETRGESSSGGVGESLQSRLRNKRHARMLVEHNAIFMYYSERYELIVVEALYQWAV
jgi:hypothetical protein